MKAALAGRQVLVAARGALAIRVVTEVWGVTAEVSLHLKTAQSLSRAARFAITGLALAGRVVQAAVARMARLELVVCQVVTAVTAEMAVMAQAVGRAAESLHMVTWR